MIIQKIIIYIKNLHRFINSGILEMFALNLLNDRYLAKVEDAMFFHATVKEELEKIEKALENYATIYSFEPDNSIKKNIILSVNSSIKEDVKHIMPGQTTIPNPFMTIYSTKQ